jgi:hypothetical protein
MSIDMPEDDSIDLIVPLGATRFDLSRALHDGRD